MKTEEPLDINSHAQLQFRIMHLNAKKEEQEMLIKRNAKEIYYSLQPAALAKTVMNELASDNELQNSVKNTSLAMGADFILGKILGRGSIKGYLASLVLGKISQYVVSKNSDAIYSGIAKGFDKIKGLFQKRDHAHHSSN